MSDFRAGMQKHAAVNKQVLSSQQYSLKKVKRNKQYIIAFFIWIVSFYRYCLSLECLYQFVYAHAGIVYKCVARRCGCIHTLFFF